MKVQFQDAWLHRSRRPEIRTIYKVVSTRATVVRYEQYLLVSSEIDNPFTPTDAPGYNNQVEMANGFASWGEFRGNVRRRWHGTTRRCNIGDKGVVKFCWTPHEDFVRLQGLREEEIQGAGTGIYTSETSSMSVHIFVECVEDTS